MTSPVIALSAGDPAGIGPELVLKTAADPELAKTARLVVVGSEDVLRTHAVLMGIRYDVPDLENVKVADVTELEPGKASAAGGRASLAYVTRALEMVQSGAADALVTGPINKVALGLAGFRWAGHTDFLMEKTGAEEVVMMLVGAGLRVGLVTHHVAVADVPRALTVGKILAVLRIMHTDLSRYFGLERPRIAVAGLNPHASDGGRFGDEEQRIIGPAIDRARDEDVNCDGPHPPDTLFVPAVRRRYDAILAMYHDQGLIPLKMLAFGRAVNLTLGLPVVRTSVDHGTAYDIAGKGTASTDSLVEAVRLAAAIVERLKR
ncbi:MAG TPA: 4-hydroxythreonine-4-phosphate dehydrogenase PdxA [Planctomycetota bacterium]|nr:4-hydroxythreonine-4-phosphate dehydrogenase PdxA [Planctomycetota bacterium]